jgi:germination protein M
MSGRIRPGIARIVGLTAVALMAASCARGAEEPSTPTTPATPTETPSPTVAPEMTTVTVYYLIDSVGRMWLAPERHEVAETARIGRVALEELIEGRPQDPDHVTPIPTGASVLDLTIEDGLATVDWSAEVLEANVGAAGESLGIQSIVWTLTEFPTVNRVRFTVEGKAKGVASNGRGIQDWWGHVGLYEQPFRRAEAIEVLEPITIWTPLDGDVVGPTFQVEGEASTFEANVPIRIFDGDGDLVQTEVTTATEGGPGRGTYRIEIAIDDVPASAESWRLEAFEESAETGEDFFVESREITVGEQAT